MSNRPSHTQGFAHIVIVAAVFALAIILGFSVFYRIQGTRDTGSSTKNTSQSTDVAASQEQTIALASDHIHLTLPAGWSVSSTHLSSDQCMHTLSSRVMCLDQTTISPNAVGKINGIPAYAATVAVYKHDDSKTAKDWWQKDYDGSNDTGTVDGGTVVDPSINKIAGYDAYYFKSQSANSSTIWYVIAGQGYIVLLTAVTSQPASATTPAQDYAIYLPAIKTFVASVKIQ